LGSIENPVHVTLTTLNIETSESALDLLVVYFVSAKLKAEFRINTDDASEQIKKSYKTEGDFSYAVGQFDTQIKEFAQTPILQLIGMLAKDFASNADLQELAMSAAGKEKENAEMQAMMQTIQPLLGTYRVTGSEGIIRKKPNAKAGVVKKIGTGSILQIIGKLPSGWLQVAKEGDAIGWINESAVTAQSLQTQPALAVTAASASPSPAAEAFPTQPVAVQFRPGKASPDDIAVIIGNANYKATAKDIQDVVPAYADAEGMRLYAMQALGIKSENVILIKDAKLKDMVATFGSENNPKGKLFHWVKPDTSNVFIYYSGHGAPNSDGSSSYLVPTDAEAALIDLSGYSLKTLYANLGKLPAKSVTVVLEACFSGATQTGMLIKNASPIYQKSVQEIVPASLTVISAGSGDQIASWEQDKSHGLFTKYYLLGMAGAADKVPYGNEDDKVSAEELAAYLKATMTYQAQRYYGREQTAQMLGKLK
jgi:hypothetical protein